MVGVEPSLLFRLSSKSVRGGRRQRCSSRTSIRQSRTKDPVTCVWYFNARVPCIDLSLPLSHRRGPWLPDFLVVAMPYGAAGFAIAGVLVRAIYLEGTESCIGGQLRNMFQNCFEAIRTPPSGRTYVAVWYRARNCIFVT